MTCERCDQWLQDLFDGAEPDAVLFERRRRQKRRRIMARAAALAAGILVILFVAEQRTPIERKTEPAAVVRGPGDAPSLRKTLTDAGTAVVESARRQVSDAVSST